MSPDLIVVLWSLLLFQIKHFLADFVFQTRYQFSNKGFYGHPGGLIHAGIHSIGSLPALLVFAPSVRVIASIVVIEFVVHYHTDWLKEQINRRKNWNHNVPQYWALFGADQLIHQLTYLAFVMLLLRWT